MTRSKNSNRPRAGSDVKHDRKGLKGTRGNVKKGGGGGNYTWGKPGDEEKPIYVKRGDPNYNSSDEEDSVVYNTVVDTDKPYPTATTKKNGVDFINHHDFSYLNHSTEKLFPPKLSLPEFKIQIVKAISEFFIEEDFDEFIQTVTELSSSMLHFELVRKLIIMAMEQNDRERELTSKMLIELQLCGLLPVNQVAKAFERLLEGVDDIVLDIPNAKRFLAQFLARCVADEVVPPAFLMNDYINQLGGASGGVVENAKVLLSINHGIGRLEHVWGKGCSNVRELKKEIRMILLEYLSSGESNEAVDLIKNLNIPYFHHEIIKRGVVISLERKEREQAMMSYLFRQLRNKEVISTKQFVLGFQRLYSEADDIVLDNPDAKTLLDIFASQSVNDNCFSSDDLSELKVQAKKNAERQKQEIAYEFGEVDGRGRERSYSVPS